MIFGLIIPLARAICNANMNGSIISHLVPFLASVSALSLPSTRCIQELRSNFVAIKLALNQLGWSFECYLAIPKDIYGLVSKRKIGQLSRSKFYSDNFCLEDRKECSLCSIRLSLEGERSMTLSYMLSVN